MNFSSILTGNDKTEFHTRQNTITIKNKYRRHRDAIAPLANIEILDLEKSKNQEKYKDFFQQGAKTISRITRIAPRTKDHFFDYLIEHRFNFGIPHCIEIFDDVPTVDEDFAIFCCANLSHFLVMMQYTNNFHMYDCTVPSTYTRTSMPCRAQRRMKHLFILDLMMK